MATRSLPTRLNAYRSWFPLGRARFVVASIVEGNSPGELFEVPSREADPVLLLWDGGNNVLYFSGAPLSQADPARLQEACEALRRRALEAGKSRFKLRVLPGAKEDLPASFSVRRAHETTTLRFAPNQSPDGPRRAADRSPTKIVAIDEELLESGLERVEEVRREIQFMWPSVQAYLEHGFGFAAINETQVICACTAEYVSAGMCGIGIETATGYRGQGIATAVGGAFIHEAFTRGMKPYWESDSKNFPSIRVAEKLGLELQGKEDYWLGSFA